MFLNNVNIIGSEAAISARRMMFLSVVNIICSEAEISVWSMTFSSNVKYHRQWSGSNCQTDNVCKCSKYRWQWGRSKCQKGNWQIKSKTKTDDIADDVRLTHLRKWRIVAFNALVTLRTTAPCATLKNRVVMELHNPLYLWSSKKIKLLLDSCICNEVHYISIQITPLTKKTDPRASSPYSLFFLSSFSSSSSSSSVCVFGPGAKLVWHRT